MTGKPKKKIGSCEYMLYAYLFGAQIKIGEEEDIGTNDVDK